jgi:hypothetical protein
MHLFCEKCGWQGNYFTAHHLSFAEACAIGIMSGPVNGGKLDVSKTNYIEKFKDCNGAICPNCNSTKLTDLKNLEKNINNGNTIHPNS